MRVTARALAARRPRPRRERDVQAAVLAALRQLPGVVAWKTGAGSFRIDGRYVRMGHKGVSDIVGWKEHIDFLVCKYAGCPMVNVTGHMHGRTLARFFACEVKAKGKVPTPEQRAFLDAVQAAGGVAVVAYEVNDVLEALK